MPIAMCKDLHSLTSKKNRGGKDTQMNNKEKRNMASDSKDLPVP
jgi:hypothetical protein